MVFLRISPLKELKITLSGQAPLVSRLSGEQRVGATLLAGVQYTTQ
jgi:hypothetical protein